MNNATSEDPASALKDQRELIVRLLGLTPDDPVWLAALAACDAQIAAKCTREVCESSCDGCSAWFPPSGLYGAKNGRCGIQTVPMGEGCKMARLQSEGEPA